MLIIASATPLLVAMNVMMINILLLLCVCLCVHMCGSRRTIVWGQFFPTSMRDPGTTFSLSVRVAKQVLLPTELSL